MLLLDGKRILIVEDNFQNRIVYQMSLLRHGANVDFENSSIEVVSHLGEVEKVDLIILDLMLGKGPSGFDVYRDIRALPDYDAVPIIAISAMDPAIAIPQARAQGFAGFIGKPVDSNLLPKQIAQILEGEQVWAAGDRKFD